jgi:hypothetical protein
VKLNLYERLNELDIWHSPPGTALGLSDGSVLSYGQRSNSWVRFAQRRLAPDERILFVQMIDEADVRFLTHVGGDSIGLSDGERKTVLLKEVSPSQTKQVADDVSVMCGSVGFVLVRWRPDVTLIEVPLIGSGYSPLDPSYENRAVVDAMLLENRLVVIVHEFQLGRSLLVWFDAFTGECLDQSEVPFEPSADGSLRTWTFAGRVGDTVRIVSSDLASGSQDRVVTQLNVAKLDLPTGAWTAHPVGLDRPISRAGRMPGDVGEIGARVFNGEVIISTRSELFDENRTEVVHGHFFPHTLCVNDSGISVVIDATGLPDETARYHTSWQRDYTAGPVFIPD